MSSDDKSSVEHTTTSPNGDMSSCVTKSSSAVTTTADESMSSSELTLKSSVQVSDRTSSDHTMAGQESDVESSDFMEEGQGSDMFMEGEDSDEEFSFQEETYELTNMLTVPVGLDDLPEIELKQQTMDILKQNVEAALVHAGEELKKFLAEKRQKEGLGPELPKPMKEKVRPKRAQLVAAVKERTYAQHLCGPSEVNKLLCSAFGDAIYKGTPIVEMAGITADQIQIFKKWEERCNLMFQAASDGNLIKVKEHILCSSDVVNAYDKKRENTTVLMFASHHGHADVVRVLLERGAKPNTQNLLGRTASMEAAEKGHLLAVKMLVKAKADLTITSKTNETALSLAETNGHVKVVNFLKSRKQLRSKTASATSKSDLQDKSSEKDGSADKQPGNFNSSEMSVLSPASPDREDTQGSNLSEHVVPVIPTGEE